MRARIAACFWLPLVIEASSTCHHVLDHEQRFCKQTITILAQAVLVQDLITLGRRVVSAMAMQALAAWVFTSSLVHVVCNTVLEADEPNAENDLGLTCSGPNATCADSNSAPGRKKGQANVLLQRQSEMQGVHDNSCDSVCSNATSVCDKYSGGSECWEYKGAQYITGEEIQNKILKGVDKNSDSHCVLGCRKAAGYLAVYNAELGKCWCYGQPVGGTVVSNADTKMYLLPHSCSGSNDCKTTTGDPTCGDECVEYGIKKTCCDTCDKSDDSRRRDGRRRGYFCSRRRS